MKREAKVLLAKSLDSLLLSINHFNAPWDRGREEAVLVLLDRSFEPFLKAAIVFRAGRIREPRARETIGFDKCVRKCLTEALVRCLSEEEALTIQMINSLRDAAQHYILDISEQQLYLHAQAGLTLYVTLLDRIFGEKLSDHPPTRVLPVSTTPPTSLDGLIQAEFSEIKRLVRPGSRKRLQARAKIRSLVIMETSLEGVRAQPSEPELGRLLTKVAQGTSWKKLFPGVASLELSTEPSSYGIAIRITKSEGEAVQLVPEGTPGATTVAVRRVNELDYYSLNITSIGEKCKLTMPKALALARHLRLKESPEYYKEFRIGSVVHKRYSPKALDAMKKALPTVDMDVVWKEHRPGKQADLRVGHANNANLADR